MEEQKNETVVKEEMDSQDVITEQPKEEVNMQEETPNEEPSYEELQAQHTEVKDKYLRLLAEFENYKKRTIREKLDNMRSAAQDTLSALLPVLDDFDRAKKAAETNDKGDLFAEGMGLVHQKLTNTLQQRGLKAMETDGQPFDPELHEALTEIPAPSEEMKGHIVDTIEKGYWLNDKIIRHAKVVVGK